jgi:mono/diheme cytochrome c family protein
MRKEHRKMMKAGVEKSRHSVRGTFAGLALVPLVTLGIAGLLPTGTSQDLPEGVTAELIATGDALFHGAALCFACHGGDGAGIPGLGADLTDDEWQNTDGSFTGLIERIREGVTGDLSSTGVPMPPMGGAQLTDEQVQAVAAYAWSLRLP